MKAWILLTLVDMGGLPRGSCPDPWSLEGRESTWSPAEITGGVGVDSNASQGLGAADRPSGDCASARKSSAGEALGGLIQSPKTEGALPNSRWASSAAMSRWPGVKLRSAGNTLLSSSSS